MRVGERVRELREFKKFTQKELACQLGESIFYIRIGTPNALRLN